jgi:peroxiredoxin
MRTKLTLGVFAALLAVAASVYWAAADSSAEKMAEKPGAPTQAVKPTSLLKTGEAAPDFTLTDTGGKKHTLSEYTKAGNVVVIEWFNPQCPVVLKYRAKSTFMDDTVASFKGKKVVWLAIDSSAPGKEGGDPEVVKQFITDHSMPVPVLLDPDGKVGHEYGAVCTPHMFVISPKNTIVYQGAPNTGSAVDPTPTGDNLVEAAVKAALAGKAPQITQTKPFGCSVKYA